MFRTVIRHAEAISHEESRGEKETNNSLIFDCIQVESMAAPKGNNNARKAKDWERALRRALAFYEDGEVPKGEALNKAAEKVVKAAVAGDWDAIEHIANRLDGKPTEHVQSDHTHRHVHELSDSELADIAAGRGTGVVVEANSAPESTEFH